MNLNELAKTVHLANTKWWQDVDTGLPIKRNKGELLALVHSELSECHEGECEDLQDDKLPDRKMGEVECVDAVIRLFDYSAGFGYDLNAAALLVGLLEFNDLNHITACAQLFDLVKQVSHGNLATVHAAVSRVLEHERKGRSPQEVAAALVHCLLSICVYAKLQGYDLQGAYTDKTAYNASRVDHSHEARKAVGGKLF